MPEYLPNFKNYLIDIQYESLKDFSDSNVSVPETIRKYASLTERNRFVFEWNCSYYYVLYNKLTLEQFTSEVESIYQKTSYNFSLRKIS